MSKRPADSSAARDALRAFAPKLVDLTDNVLFGDVWERPGLSKRDRSLITCAALVALNRTEQQTGHCHHNRLEHGPVRNHDGRDDAAHHQRRVIGRFEASGYRRERHREGSDQEGAHRAAHERANRGDSQRQSGTAIARHRVAIKARNRR